MLRKGDFAKLCARGGRERILLVEAAYWILLARLLIALLPFRIVVQMFGLRVQMVPRQDALTPAAAAAIDAVRIVGARLRPVNTCLAEALAGAAMLARRGVLTTLYLGVAKEQSSLLAHAWLSACGQTVLGAAERERFRTIAIFYRAPKP